MENLNYLMDQDYFEYIHKQNADSTNKSRIRIYVNRIENRITYRIKKASYIELWTPEAMKLLGSTKSKINKDKNSENVLHLEINEVVLVSCNIVNNNHEPNSRAFTFVPNKSFRQFRLKT